MHGYAGRILKINLSDGTIAADDYDASFARAYLGGNGFAARLVYDGVPADADPLGPENTIAFAVGPLTDTPVWGAGRGHVAAISPLTGLFVDSNFGGNFPVAQKRTGFDAISITGKSDQPVYILVTESGAEIKNAADLWGKTTEEANAALKRKEGPDAVALSIGPAGENMVLFANIVGDGARRGAAGRGGLGAVMGAKYLKAIVAAGATRTRIAHPDKLKNFLAEKREQLLVAARPLSTHGTSFLVEKINDRGLLGTHNATTETFPFARDIGGEVMKERYIIGNSACRGCPVACGKKVSVPSGIYAGRTLKMPEYETLYAMGAMLDNRDLLSIINANGVCDLYGLDTITMGVTLAFVAECLEDGLANEAELGGRIAFADGPGMVAAVKATAAKSGIGRLLALGSQRLADRFGPEAQKLLYAVKGLEIAGHSARGLRPMSLGYATATRGGSHQDTRPQYLVPNEDPGFDPQPEYNFHSQNFTAVGDSLVMCRFLEERAFGSRNNETLARALNHVTGWNTDAPELETIGERIYTLERMINVRRGLRRKHDTLPWRTMHAPIPHGPAKGSVCPPETLDAMLDAYYRLRGWTHDGVPSSEKLKQLGLA